MANGLDVSMHNGTIDFAKVKLSGYECVYIKATEGTTFIDPLLEQNYVKARAANLKTGFYHFLVGTSSPETQAESFYKNIKGKANDLRACLDIEKTGFAVMDYAIRFINKFESLTNDIKICIYTSPYFANSNLDNRLKEYPCWIAHYEKKPWEPGNTEIWGKIYCGHQYSDTGNVSGINGKVDLNVFNLNILNNVKEEEEVDYNYNFSESYYAEKNPDVVKVYGNSREALLDHYIRRGRDEGRLPTPPTDGFNEAYYLLNNPDVNINVSSGNGFASGLAHYRCIGWKENRSWDMPSYKSLDILYEFSENYYRKKNPDVVKIYGSSRDKLLAHYIEYGKAEGRLPTPPTDGFNEAYYLLNNPDVYDAIKKGMPWCVNGLAHYRYTGWEENRSWAKPKEDKKHLDKADEES
ncbi:MAG: hypothetical protein E7214_08315 [Clostridium sp.]|nr:hypothetical protein [Clostridium sp.]